MIKLLFAAIIVGLFWYGYKELRKMWKTEDRQQELTEAKTEALEELDDLNAEIGVMDVKEVIQERESNLDARIDKFNEKV